MDAVVTSIRKLSSSREDLAKLQKRLDGSTKLLKKNVGTVTNSLKEGILSPEVHSYGYLVFLHSIAMGEISNHNDFVELCRPLLLQGSGSQIRLDGTKFCQVCRKFSTSLILTEKPMRGVGALRNAVRLVQGSRSNMLSGVHADLMLVSLKAGTYRVASSVLDVPVYEIAPKANGMQPVDLLMYYYYGGMVRIGLKQWNLAIESFQMALTCPSHAVSALQIAAFKRYILCGLILHHEYLPLSPQTTSQVVLRSVERYAGAYVELAREFKKSQSDLKRTTERHMELFVKDSNFGLVKQVLSAHVRRSIQRLTNTYVTLSLEDIAKNVNLESAAVAEKHVLDMIEDGMIEASINQRDGMLSFLEGDTEFAPTAALVAKLDANIQEVMGLSARLGEVDRELSLNSLYIQKTMPREEEDGGGSFGRGGGGRPPRGHGGQSQEDRDIARALQQSLIGS